MSNRKQELSDSANKIDTEVLELLDELKVSLRNEQKSKSEEICESLV